MMDYVKVNYEEIRLSREGKKDPSHRIVVAIANNWLHCDGNELFRWELGNAGLEELPNAHDPAGEMPDGSYIITRLLESSFNGIDGVWALGHALTYFKENKLRVKTTDETWKNISRNFDEVYG